MTGSENQRDSNFSTCEERSDEWTLRMEEKARVSAWTLFKSVKSIPPTTENWLPKRYKYSKKNYKSTEDKHEDQPHQQQVH